jgi:hypothetical protein
VSELVQQLILANIVEVLGDVIDQRHAELEHLRGGRGRVELLREADRKAE